MATATGTNVKFVKVKTKQQYTDYTEKDGALIFVENERKIYVDGIAYGFSDSDVANKFVKLTGDTMTGSLKIGNTANHTVYESNRILLNHTDGLPRIIKQVTGGIEINIGDTSFEFKEDKFLIKNGQEDDPVVISGVADPVSNDDAVNKGYLDTNVISKIGANSGIASLDSTGKVPSTQLPSYVDDVLEYSAKASFPATGETGKLYIDLSNNNVWRWSGSAYVNVSDGNAHLTLGTTSSTAYQGNLGKIAFDHSQLTTGNPHGVTKAQVLLGQVENYPMATPVEAQTGDAQNRYMNPWTTRLAIEWLSPKLTWEVVE